MFGVANAVALRQKLKGFACRGKEYDVVLSWSFVSGKRRLTVNGEIIHRDTSFGKSFYHGFRLESGHFVEVDGCISVRGKLKENDVDLRVNGLSHYKFKRIYELGTFDEEDDERDGIVINPSGSELLKIMRAPTNDVQQEPEDSCLEDDNEMIDEEDEDEYDYDDDVSEEPVLTFQHNLQDVGESFHNRQELSQQMQQEYHPHDSDHDFSPEGGPHDYSPQIHRVYTQQIRQEYTPHVPQIQHAQIQNEYPQQMCNNYSGQIHNQFSPDITPGYPVQAKVEYVQQIDPNCAPAENIAHTHPPHPLAPAVKPQEAKVEVPHIEPFTAGLPQPPSPAYGIKLSLPSPFELRKRRVLSLKSLSLSGGNKNPSRLKDADRLRSSTKVGTIVEETTTRPEIAANNVQAPNPVVVAATVPQEESIKIPPEVTFPEDAKSPSTILPGFQIVEEPWEVLLALNAEPEDAQYFEYYKSCTFYPPDVVPQPLSTTPYYVPPVVISDNSKAENVRSNLSTESGYYTPPQGENHHILPGNTTMDTTTSADPAGLTPPYQQIIITQLPNHNHPKLPLSSSIQKPGLRRSSTDPAPTNSTGDASKDDSEVSLAIQKLVNLSDIASVAGKSLQGQIMQQILPQPPVGMVIPQGAGGRKNGYRVAPAPKS